MILIILTKLEYNNMAVVAVGKTQNELVVALGGKGMIPIEMTFSSDQCINKSIEASFKKAQESLQLFGLIETSHDNTLFVLTHYVKDKEVIPAALMHFKALKQAIPGLGDCAPGFKAVLVNPEKI